MVGTHHWRLVGWSIPLLLLAIPLLLNFPWTPFDYAAAAMLFTLAGAAVELAVRASRGNTAYRVGGGVAVLAALLLVWVNGAVGFLGDEGNPANLMFGGVIAVAALGAALARLRPAGLAWAMTAAAIAQLLAGVIGLAAGWASPGRDGVFEVVIGTGIFGALWLVAAGLFRKAQREWRAG